MHTPKITMKACIRTSQHPHLVTFSSGYQQSIAQEPSASRVQITAGEQRAHTQLRILQEVVSVDTVKGLLRVLLLNVESRALITARSFLFLLSELQSYICYKNL
ncbi:uncharacterized protein LOC109022744 [Parus major]|uniref:uncharacterized protein LOC109022744 n=1 Tax=Parus major TaxID=9157 RepID=UPI00144452D1|nr:uncharacterized protein LOC109022744 [Parus major]